MRLKLVILSTVLVASKVFGLPSGASVKSGTATVSSSSNGNSMTINSVGNKAIINWDSFDVSKGQTVQFTSDANGAFYIYNRVPNSSKATTINGNLLSNQFGNIYLFNPKGITLDSKALVQVGSFLATTLDATLFDPTKDMTFQGSSTAVVTNKGNIVGTNGDVFLIGYRVKNEGTLSSTGVAGMAAGSQVLLKPAETDKIFIGTTFPIATTTETGVTNSGTVRSLNTVIKANGNAYAVAINNSGTINASDCSTSGGRVLLFSKVDSTNCTNGLVVNTGKVASAGTTGNGPNVIICGPDIQLQNGTAIDVSGDTGGGSVVIGCDSDCGTNAKTVCISSGASIKSNALLNGNGGDICITGTDSLTMLGSIEALGGTTGGDGGTAILTGPCFLGYDGTTNLSTQTGAGTIGTLTLSSSAMLVGGTSNFSTDCTGSCAQAPCLSSAVTTTALQNSLANANVSIFATAETCPGDIKVIDNITWDSGNLFLMNAKESLFLDYLLSMTGSAGITANVVELTAGNAINIGLKNHTHTNAVGVNVQNGVIKVNSGTDLLVSAGSAQDASAVLQSANGSLDVDFGGTLDLLAGDLDGAFALFSTTNGNLTVDANSTCSDINVKASGCESASIEVSNGDLIVGGTNHPRHMNILAGGCNTGHDAFVGSHSFANVTINLDGDLTITAGDCGNMNNALIQVEDGIDRIININAQNIFLNGGMGTDSFSSNNVAAIVNRAVGGQINTVALIDTILTAGNKEASGSLVNFVSDTISVESGRNLSLYGGSKPMNSAAIDAQSGVKVLVGGDLNLESGCDVNAFASIFTDQGNIIIDTSTGLGDITMVACDQGASNSFASIQVRNDGDILIGQTSGKLFNDHNIRGGGEGEGFAGIFVGNVGNTFIKHKGQFTLQSGSATNAFAGVRTNSGSHTIESTQKGVRLVGNCNVPSDALFEVNGAGNVLRVKVARDAERIDNGFFLTNTGSSLNLSVGGSNIVRACSTPVPPPPVPPHVDPSQVYFKYKFLYELFYRLRYFTEIEWCRSNVYTFWQWTDYTSP